MANFYASYPFEGGGGGGGSGTVTSVGLSLPGIFTVSGSPVTTSGTLTAVLATESANTVFAGPTSGGAATPTFRALTGTDIGGFTQGSVIFAGASGQLAQDNNQFFWNDTSHFLGIGTVTPASALDVFGTISIKGSNGLYEDSGSNLVVGPSSFPSAISGGTNNVAVGYNALTSTTSGNNNVAIGYLPLVNNTTGINNVAIGNSALFNNQIGNDCIAIGVNSLYFANGTGHNIAIGQGSQNNNGSGSNNIGLGVNSAYNNRSGSANVIIGSEAVENASAPSNVVAIGSGVGSTLDTGTNNILIGTNNNTDTPAAGTSNFMNLGCTVFATGMTGTIASPAGSVGINIVAPAYVLDVAGDVAADLVGHGFRVKEGSNAKQGTVILSGGATTVVSNTSVTANSRIFLTSQVDGGTPGFLRVSTRSAGTSFTITSSTGTLDTSTVAYQIFEPA